MGVLERTIEVVRENLPFETDLPTVNGESLLVELGVTSLHLISILLALQREYLLDIESVLRGRMPITVADLSAAVEKVQADG